MVGSNVLINKDREKLPPSLSTYTNLIKKHLNLFLHYGMVCVKKQKYINPDGSISFIRVEGKVKCGKMTEIIKLKWKSSDFGE